MYHISTTEQFQAPFFFGGNVMEDTVLDVGGNAEIVIEDTALDYGGLRCTSVNRIADFKSDKNMEIERKCLWCGKSFIAHTMVTRYCSPSCNNKDYKDKQRKKRLQEYVDEEAKRPIAAVGAIGAKEYLTPNECAVLLGVCRSTIYNMLATGALKGLQARKRKTIVRRSDIERMFDEAPAYVKHKRSKHKVALYYTTQEIMDKYHIQKKTIYRRCQLNGIPKIEEGNRVFYNRALIDKYFADLEEEINPDLYYTPDEVMEKYGMTRAAVVAFAMRHNIPRINRHHQAYYSRAHIDAIKQQGTKLNPDYYTYDEIAQKYGMTTINISYYVNKYDIERMKQGSRTLVLRTAFDKVLREHRDGTYKPQKRGSKDKEEPSA